MEVGPRVSALTIAAPRPEPEVVALLSSLLDRAEAGEIVGVAVGVSCTAGDTASAYAIGSATIADLYLGIERAKCRLLAHGEPG